MDKLGTIQDFKDLRGVKGLKMVHCNVRSMIKKIDQIRLMVEGSEVDVLTLSETWLRRHLASGLVDIEGYRAFRQDRYIKAGRGGRGGGLISYVGNKYAESCESIYELNISNENIEAHAVALHT